MGTLDGIRIIELSGLGPAPMAGMMLADMGAEVIRVERYGAWNPLSDKDISFRGKQSIVLNLRETSGVELLLDLVETADVLIDPYRPGVCEKLGFGPDVCWERNPKLIFARMTGWGQEGPLAGAAGHDINYIAITGALHAIGRAGDKPVPPLNLLGDMGGGGMLLVNGILAGLLECSRSGQGQIVDAAMVDGTAQLMWMQYGFTALGEWDETRREANMLDGGAHFYNTYECADGKYICLGSIEPQFYALLVEKTGVDPEMFAPQHNREIWPQLKTALTEVFKTKTQNEWCEIMEATDVCFAPVLTHLEAPHHHANVARKTYIEVDDIVQPAPAPRFSRTPSKVRHGPVNIGAHTDSTLASLGIDEDQRQNLRTSGIIQ